jgi:predicted Zn-dependent protease
MQYYGQVGKQRQKMRTHSRQTTALYQLNKKSKKKEDPVEVGTDYENQRAKDYLTATQELKRLLNNNKNGCIRTFLQGLTPTESIAFSLWKATNKIK